MENKIMAEKTLKELLFYYQSFNVDELGVGDEINNLCKQDIREYLHNKLDKVLNALDDNKTTAYEEYNRLLATELGFYYVITFEDGEQIRRYFKNYYEAICFADNLVGEDCSKYTIAEYDSYKDYMTSY